MWVTQRELATMGTGSSTAVVVLDGGPTVEILLEGDLDLAISPLLAPVVRKVLGDPEVRSIELDVALVAFCDSSGLSALLNARNRAADKGVALRLVRVGARLERLLAATGLGRVLGVAG